MVAEATFFADCAFASEPIPVLHMLMLDKSDDKSGSRFRELRALLPIIEG